MSRAPAPKAIPDPPSHVFCTHGRLPDTCEDCRFTTAVERGRVHGTLHPEAEPAPDPVLAEDDTLISTATPGRFRLVKAGDPLPVREGGEAQG